MTQLPWESNLQDILKRFDEVEADLANPETSQDRKKLLDLSRERSRLEPIVKRINKLAAVRQELKDAQALFEKETDDALKNLAKEEIGDLERNEQKILTKLETDVLPVDPSDERDAILEIRSGAGGDEAALFGSDLLRMYTRYAERQGWRTNLMSANRTGIGGIKEAVLEIKGNGVFGRLKYESGVQRIQRIPETEKSGRVHTSTATVAVLPIAEEVDLEIKPSDLRIDVYRSSGHGGQSVNTTDSAVRITHVPTGVVVAMQDERSQLKNKDKAMKILRSRLLDAEQERAAKDRGAMRKVQVGTGDRSEKIRTYNVPQDRITDHRIKFTTHNVTAIFDGGLDEIIDKLIEANQAILKKNLK